MNHSPKERVGQNDEKKSARTVTACLRDMPRTRSTTVVAEKDLNDGGDEEEPAEPPTRAGAAEAAERGGRVRRDVAPTDVRHVMV